MDVIADENLLVRAHERGEQLMEGLRQAQQANPNVVKAVRGQGLMVGVEFEIKDMAELTINLLAGEGIIAAYTLNNPNVIRMEPPLIISPAQIDRAVNAFGSAVTSAANLLSGLEEE